ncbi:TPA: D5 N like family protein [Pasteurella multocida]|nr:D5 N like family protein [Pasteurella multocida OH1905]HDR1115181.1 D5 N like family protein [Pasteurella multocida]HDR1189185.1 D5 N like family protein [Pasteurella multocida]HDR1206009.1 D5 N like family protein [Pasteurella multocida]HDR1219867.1 D5 N like family protein [Pasteurella multocida]
MKTKLKNAPHLAEQPLAPFEDMLILAGSSSWQAWNKGKNEEWYLLCQALRHSATQKPVILGESQLKEIQALKLAEEEQQFIKIAIFGKLSEQYKTAICLNLAKNTQARTVQFINNIGELVEDVSGYIQRLREDESTAQQAEKIAPKAKIQLDFETEKPTQPEIAEAFLSWIDKPIRQDADIGKTFEYNGLYWQILPDHALMQKVMAFYDKQNYRKYTARSLKSMAELIGIMAEKIPHANQDLIGFQNGVLNKKTGEFLTHNINHYLRSVENFNCTTQNKSTPYFDDWIDFVSNGNQNKRNAILAGLYMVLTNRHEWGLFLEATGIAGAGKSVFSQIASIINGGSNTAYISLQELEIDRKRAMLIGKSLAISPDQKPYKGSADELKAITGGDSVTVKLVYVDDFAVKLNPVFMLVTNYPLLFTDRNGGIARRRIIIPFDRAIPKEKKDVHFIDKVQTEVYGIVNKLLALFPNPDDARLILEEYKDLDEGKNIKREANHLIDFLGHFELRENALGALRLGSARNNSVNGLDFTLYSAYCFYCECHSINPLNLFSFKNSLPDAFKESGQKIDFNVTLNKGYPRTNAFWKDKENTLKNWNG